MILVARITLVTVGGFTSFIMVFLTIPLQNVPLSRTLSGLALTGRNSVVREG